MNSCGGRNVVVGMKQIIQIKRAYDPASPDDGYRVLVDKLWPQGLSHQTFHYDLWAKEITPSTALREWFHQDPDGRWEEFAERYRAELAHNPAFPAFKQKLAAYPKVTLLYASRSLNHNHALIIEQALE